MNLKTKTFQLVLLSVALLAVSVVAHAQDKLSTSNGDVMIYPVLHGSLVLQWQDMNIFVDPYGGAALFEGYGDPDVILITDIHGDHLHENTLSGLSYEDTKFIVPQAVYDRMKDDMKERATIIANGESTELLSMKVEAVPMYNLPETADSRHPKGRGNGYLLKIADKTIYISGDTEDIREMRELSNIDVAFVCMNLPYTMTVEQAASAVNQFRPAVVYPFHYRGKDGLADLDKFAELVSDGIEVLIRDWYANAN
jgi:L-ascorbate metabolism protein UlaG (beta-lactamase superfamily)